jgi:hypothetical protein
MINILKNLWFDDIKAPIPYINDTAMRIRAGILLFVPIFMSFTLYDALFLGNYSVDTNTLVDTYETNWDDQIIYTAEVVKRINDYTTQTYILFFALFEMLAGMFVFTSRLSPLILISSFLAKNYRVVLKPLAPKRFAWALGGSMISICLIFFNPDTFAGYVNVLFDSELLPTTRNYIPPQIPVSLVWFCVLFMWLEVVFGFCVGCKIHSLLVFLRIIKDECEDCNDITKVNK